DADGRALLVASGRALVVLGGRLLTAVLLGTDGATLGLVASGARLQPAQLTTSSRHASQRMTSIR
ncbi:MAG TPA: hypothetical protein VFU36_17105, partial [Jatrophihabitans sp.]|nr:hypothetical protein [Jatrophihabitans sp.]